MKTFAKILNAKCGCGRVVSFNVPKAADFAGLTGQEENIRGYIRGNCGCVGRTMNMYCGESRVNAKSITCAHVKMTWIDDDIQKELLEGKSQLKIYLQYILVSSVVSLRFDVWLLFHVRGGNWLRAETNRSKLKYFGVFKTQILNKKESNNKKITT